MHLHTQVTMFHCVLVVETCPNMLSSNCLKCFTVVKALTNLGYTDLACSYGRKYPNTLKLYCIKVFLWKKFPLYVR